VFAHQFGQDLVLLLQLGLEGLDLALILGLLTGAGGLGLEDHGALLEELFLPEVEERGLEAMLLTDIGDGHLVDEVFAENGQFFGPGEMTAVFGHWRCFHVAPVYSCNADGPILQFGLRQHTNGPNGLTSCVLIENRPFVPIVTRILS
jgi:hypothetical protein